MAFTHPKGCRCAASDGEGNDKVSLSLLRTRQIECMCCGVEACRHEYQAQLATLNAPWMDKHAEALGMGDKPKSGGDPDVRLRADGDADVEPGERLKDFVVPECSECGGFLKVKAWAAERFVVQRRRFLARA